MSNQSDATTRLERPIRARRSGAQTFQTLGRAADRPNREDGAPESTTQDTMMNRSTTTSVTGRASAMRRMRRRTSAVAGNGRLFCSTNGCPSFLDIDPETGIASCHICGFVRRVH